MATKPKTKAADPQAWKADKIEQRSVAALTPYAKNARTHSDKQVDQLVASIKHFGFTQPVLIRESGEIIAGHGRVMAAERMGLETVPVIVAPPSWSEADIRAYVLADNKLAENAGWDKDLLKVEMGALADLNFDLGLTGFDVSEVRFLTTPDGKSDPDAVPPAPVKPKSKLGDIWILGEHRLGCGDSTDADTVKRLLNGTTPALMVTDPPYGVEYDPDWRLRAGINKSHQTLANGVVSNDDRADWLEAWRLFPGAVAYVWHGGLHSEVVARSLREAGFEMRAQIIWHKPSLVMGRGHYHWQHEPCWYAARGTANWQGDRKQSTIWDIPNMHRTQGDVDDGKTVHSTQKPVECMARPIRNNSAAGDLVYDPFLGSGTTLIAAEKEGRICYGMELSPIYCDVIVKRWEDFTGKKAVREPKKAVKNGK